MSFSSLEKNIKILEFLKRVNELHWFSKLNYSQNPKLLEILNNLAANEKYNLELRVAVSIEEKAISIRYLSYFIPSLELLTLFNRGQKEGLFLGKINLRIFFNQNLGKYINQEVEDFDTYFKRNKNLIQTFIRSYYPKIIKLIQIRIDDFVYRIIENQDNLSNQEKDNILNHPFFEKLLHFSEKRNLINAQERALKYVLGHTILFGDFIHLDSENKPNAIITIGGPAEKYFNHFRKTISEKLDLENHYKPLQVRLIQNNGGHPPYYTYPNDIEIIEVLTSEHEQIIKKLVSSFPEDFKTLTSSITTKNKLKSYLYFLKQFLQTNT